MSRITLCQSVRFSFSFAFANVMNDLLTFHVNLNVIASIRNLVPRLSRPIILCLRKLLTQFVVNATLDSCCTALNKSASIDRNT